ncbi:MAG TPA: O-antigen ligase family protein [Roseococcus sp.]|nr:O-antigen ligase family protein [Roseococcus sp.]
MEQTSTTPPSWLRRLDGPGTALAMAVGVAIPWVVIASRSAAEAVVAGLAAGFLLHLLATRNAAPLRAPWFLLAMGYWAWLVLATALAGAQPDQMLAALTWGRFPLATLAIATWAFSSARAQRLALWALAGAVLFVGLEIWLQFIFGHGLVRSGTALPGYLPGPFLRPRAGGYLAVTLWPVLVPAVVLLAAYGMRGHVAGVTLVALAVGAVLMAGQRSPLIMVLFGLVLAALALRPLRLPALVAVLGGATMLGLAAIVAPNTFYRYAIHLPQLLANFPETHYGQILARALAMVEAHPWLGAGAEAFRTGCYDPRFHIGWGGVGDGGGAAMCVTHVHHFYLEALVDAGIPGLVLFTASCLALLWALGRGAERDPLRLGLFLSALIALWPVATAGAYAGIDQAALRVFLMGLGLALAMRRAA